MDQQQGHPVPRGDTRPFERIPQGRADAPVGPEIIHAGLSQRRVPNFPDELFTLCQSIAKHCEDDWAFLGSYAFAHHETGRLDEAFKLASKSLEMYPLNAVAFSLGYPRLLREGRRRIGRRFPGKLAGRVRQTSFLSCTPVLAPGPIRTGYGPVQERPGPVRDRHTPVCSGLRAPHHWPTAPP